MVKGFGPICDNGFELYILAVCFFLIVLLSMKKKARFAFTFVLVVVGNGFSVVCVSLGFGRFSV